MPRFLTMVKGSESYPEPPPQLFEAMDALMKDAGTRLVGVGGLLKSSKGARARLTNGKVTFTDGPFTEAKEVVGGFAIYDVPTLEDVKPWIRRFLDLHIKYLPTWDCEVEIREMMAEPLPARNAAPGGISR